MFHQENIKSIFEYNLGLFIDRKLAHSGKIECPRCNKQFLSLDYYELHLKTQHSD